MPTARQTRSFTAVVLLAAVFVACSTTGDSDTTERASRSNGTERSADSSFSELATDGPYDVGVTTLSLGDRDVEVWYPATDVAPDAPRVSYSILDWMPLYVQMLISEADRPVVATTAVRDAEPMAASFPLIVFSHGQIAYRAQSTFLTHALASWGFVVAAPDHIERGVQTILVPADSFGDDVGDLQRTIDLALAMDSDPASLLYDRIDEFAIGALGHSAGGVTAIRLAAVDPRVRSVVAQAAVIPADTTWPRGTSLMLQAGTDDDIVPLADIRRSYAAVRRDPGTSMAVFEAAGHLVFSDVCQLAADKGGLFGLAASYGVTVDEETEKLGTDGCQADELPAVDAWPVIRQLTIAQFRATLTGAPLPPEMQSSGTLHIDDVTVEFSTH